MILSLASVFVKYIIALRNASIGQLARAVAEAARLMRSEEIRRLQEHPEDDAVRHIEDALDQLTYLHNQIQRGT